MKRIIYCNKDFECRVNWLVKEYGLAKGYETAYFAGDRDTYKLLCSKCAKKNLCSPLLITDEYELARKGNYLLLTEDYYANRDFMPEFFGNTTNVIWFITVPEDTYLHRSFYRLNKNWGE